MTQPPVGRPIGPADATAVPRFAAGRPVRAQDVRASSKLLRPYHPALDVSPFAAQQVADAGGPHPLVIKDNCTDPLARHKSLIAGQKGRRWVRARGRFGSG